MAKAKSKSKSSRKAKPKSGHWIQTAIKRPGALHTALGVPQGQTIPVGKIEQAEKSKDKRVAQEARLAMTMRGFHHKGKKKAKATKKKK